MLDLSDDFNGEAEFASKGRIAQLTANCRQPPQQASAGQRHVSRSVGRARRFTFRVEEAARNHSGPQASRPKRPSAAGARFMPASCLKAVVQWTVDGMAHSLTSCPPSIYTVTRRAHAGPFHQNPAMAVAQARYSNHDSAYYPYHVQYKLFIEFLVRENVSGMPGRFSKPHNGCGTGQGLESWQCVLLISCPIHTFNRVP